MLTKQSERNFEVLIVDSGSTDKTMEIAKTFEARLKLEIFEIPERDFTYPYACNYGADNASGEYLVYLSGHSVPRDSKWLLDGLRALENSKKIAGVFGNVLASSDASVWEKIWYFNGKFAPKKIFYKPQMGILGNTNAIIPHKLWQEHHFDESYSEGGEDGEWAKYYLEKGYQILRDPNFAVYHSHGLGLFGFLHQLWHWFKVYKKFTSC